LRGENYISPPKCWKKGKGLKNPVNPKVNFPAKTKVFLGKSPPFSKEKIEKGFKSSPKERENL